MIIDDTTLFLVCASLKDLGSKFFASVDDISACDVGTRPTADNNGVRLVSQIDGLAVGGVGRDRLATAVDARERVDATRRAAPEGDRAETAED